MQTGTSPAAVATATDGVDPPPRPTVLAREYETLTTWERFDDWLSRLQAAELVAIDTETDSLDPMRARIVGISFAVEPGRAAYVPLAHGYPGVPDQLPLQAVLYRLRPWLCLFYTSPSPRDRTRSRMPSPACKKKKQQNKNKKKSPSQTADLELHSDTSISATY